MLGAIPRIRSHVPAFLGCPAGLGSPHTPKLYIWPLAHAVTALTSGDPQLQARLLRELLGMQCGNGLMHESVNIHRPSRCTRPLFEWANAMLVVLAEQLLGEDCEAPAQEEFMRAQVREPGRRVTGPPRALAAAGALVTQLLLCCASPNPQLRHEMSWVRWAWGLKPVLMYKRLELAIRHAR